MLSVPAAGMCRRALRLQRLAARIYRLAGRMKNISLAGHEDKPAQYTKKQLRHECRS